MRHLFIPLIFSLFLPSGWVLAQPPENPYVALDVDTDQVLMVHPVSAGVAVALDIDTGETENSHAG